MAKLILSFKEQENFTTDYQLLPYAHIRWKGSVSTVFGAKFPEKPFKLETPRNFFPPNFDLNQKFMYLVRLSKHTTL